MATRRRRTAATGNAATPESVQRGGMAGFADYLLTRQETRLALVGAAGVTLTLLASLALPLPVLAIYAACTIALLVALWPIARSGFNALRNRRAFNINLLMTIAALGAIALGEFLEAAAVVVLFALGEALEGYNMGRTRASLRSLMDLAPPQALRLQNGQERQVPVAELQPGDQVLVRAGDSIPVDGTVLDGYSDVNQASLTGESLPRTVGPGDEVYAGHSQRRRRACSESYPPGAGQRHQPHHPPRGGSTGNARALLAPYRPLRARLHAAGGPHGPAGRHRTAALLRSTLPE